MRRHPGAEEHGSRQVIHQRRRDRANGSCRHRPSSRHELAWVHPHPCHRTQRHGDEKYAGQAEKIDAFSHPPKVEAALPEPHPDKPHSDREHGQS